MVESMNTEFCLLLFLFFFFFFRILSYCDEYAVWKIPKVDLSGLRVPNLNYELILKAEVTKKVHTEKYDAFHVHENPALNVRYMDTRWSAIVSTFMSKRLTACFPNGLNHGRITLIRYLWEQDRLDNIKHC